MTFLFEGDCLEILPTLESNSVDAIITDLPYGTTNCKWDSAIPLSPLWEQYERIIKDDKPIVLFSAQPFTTTLITSNVRKFKYCWYWVKEKGTGFLNAKKQPMRVVEEICVFYDKLHTYNPQMIPLEKPYKHTLPIKKSDINKGGIKSMAKEEREYVTYTHTFPKNTLFYPRDKANKGLVPTQKPVGLLEYLVKTYTNENDVVLDSCMGSGTTGIACLNLNRRFVGIELDKEHFAIAKDRLNLFNPSGE